MPPSFYATKMRIEKNAQKWDWGSSRCDTAALVIPLPIVVALPNFTVLADLDSLGRRGPKYRVHCRKRTRQRA
eukprot:1189342-Prorocentrum_minimum.AAC.3